MNDFYRMKARGVYVQATERNHIGDRPAGGPDPAGALLRRVAVRHRHDLQRHPLQCSCGQPQDHRADGGAAHRHRGVLRHFHDRSGNAHQAVEVDRGLRCAVYPAAEIALWRQRRYRQHRVAEIPLSAGEHRSGGGSEDHLHHPAGVAAPMAAGGKTGPEVLFRRLLCGRSCAGDSGTVLCYFRRYGQRADVPADFCGDVLCGRLCPAVVRTAFRRIGGRHRGHYSL